ncbi:MAG TPA: GTPase HflX [Gemmatimonadaceae bacterium]|nr:GTPase HflX [Gemmatimonadaceae bacterium]
MLVGAPIKRSAARHHLEEHLEELERLADTAGATVVATLTQQIDRPNPATYLGKGKIEELRNVIEDRDATLVIFDDELTPAQGKNVEDTVGRRVMDRAELILDIFATRARTHEAKLQVELAQLEYMLPRLTRMWAHLEKTRGGIGLRGPGETQLETDRRLINHRIKVLHERLHDVATAREVQRRGRRGEFRASLVGYTNAGKSSILRAMSQVNDVFVEDRLFATLDPLTRDVALGDRERVLLTDTVGFIRKLPHDLVASFRATLEEVREADVLIHVIDASHLAWEEQREVVDDVLSDLGAADRPTILAFNKIDRLDTESVTALRERMAGAAPESVFVSALRSEGVEPLRKALQNRLHAARPIVQLRVPVTNGGLLAAVHRAGEVIEQRQDDHSMLVSARLDEAAVARLVRGGAVVESSPSSA